MKSKRTKALEIPMKVKLRVWERDGFRCILCGSREANPNAHYIPRSKGGLGIEQNIVTLCLDCHRKMDQSAHRKECLKNVRDYLMSKYPDFNEEELFYKK